MYTAEPYFSSKRSLEKALSKGQEVHVRALSDISIISNPINGSVGLTDSNQKQYAVLVKEGLIIAIYDKDGHVELKTTKRISE